MSTFLCEECDGYRRYYKAERGYNRFVLFSLGSKRCPKCRILIIKNKVCLAPPAVRSSLNPSTNRAVHT